LDRRGTGAHPAGAAPAIVHRVIASPGRPLTSEARGFFEPRLGVDLSTVRIHDDRQAAESARAVGAHAYTIGDHISFADGRHDLGTESGRKLLAHELVHVAQHRAVEAASHGPGSGSSTLRRACGAALGTPTATCAPSSEPVVGTQFAFVVNCDDLQPGEAQRVTLFARGLRPFTDLRVHGYASEEGPPEFNERLSCHRANAIAGMLRSTRMDCPVTSLLAHGAQRAPPSREFWRAVIVESLPLRNVCGPDATTWLIDQVARAKTDPAVLDIQSTLAGASRVAASGGFSSGAIAEGAVGARVVSEEADAGSPPRTPAAAGQIAASVPGQRAFGRALIGAPVPIFGRRYAQVLAAVRSASLGWKHLVGTGRRYDFKNDATTMRGPTSQHCPVACPGTITLCHPTASACVGTDVPGNLFYAHIGRFIGFSELALQLGSEFAQLESSSAWDPPEDTAMIRVGWALPDPLDRTALCSAIASLHGTIEEHPCTPCSEPTHAHLV